MRYFIDTVTSPAYWRYVLFSKVGIQTVLATFGAIWLLVESLDFFNIYKQDQYGAYAFWWILIVSVVLAIFLRRPVRSIEIRFPEKDCCLGVRIGDIFDATGAVVVSTNTQFECDVAGGKISPESLQGQFTARYFTGDQETLIKTIREGLEEAEGPPYPMGTVVPVNTHGKTFYFVAMANLNEKGTASTTMKDLETALSSLWRYVRESGELQELVVPVIGTARGRLRLPRKKVIEKITESFVDASSDAKFTDRLIVMIHPEDAKRFKVNLHDIKDHLNHTLIRK
ncbi:MAG: macro domain-containing protein [Opitutales bacterium]